MRCLVIGGGSDIGSAIVRELHAREHEVLWTYFSTERDQPGKGIRCDLTDLLQVRELFDSIGGDIRLMVTAAFPFLECGNLDFDGYDKAEAFLRGHVYATTRFGNAWRMREGKIINLLGQCVERGLPGGAFYSAAFAFLHNYGNSINAREAKAHRGDAIDRAKNLAVCDLLLGPVDTREWSGLSKEVVGRYEAKVSRFIAPEQVARTVAFLSEQDVMPSTFKLDAYYGY
ncbi:MAG: hypothetical protein RLZZ324_649 [Candidatus Parcubacteria bacterium]|jgi:NAD(P)-dependent dehydrogenase (short-subunit alcohol dehydrogenase family)